MRETTRPTGALAAVAPRRIKRQSQPCCSVCLQHTWFSGISLMEPEGAPEPRTSWTLCKNCYNMLLIEMRRSPVRSPLRLRIAVGLVAAERSPNAYHREGSFAYDRKWIVLMGWGFLLFMILHLVLLVLLAFVAK